jgi:uncharacterized membrane protein
MRINHIVILFLLLSIFLSSCDTGNFVDYTVINSTSGTVKITYNKIITTDSSGKDTTIYLRPNQKQIIDTAVLFASSVFNPESRDTIMELPVFIASLNDTLPSTVNVKKMTYWNYHYISRHHAELVINLYDSLFNH